MSFLDVLKEVADFTLFLAVLCVATVILYYIIMFIYRIITGKYNNPKAEQPKDNRKYIDYQSTLTNFFINRIDEDIEKMPDIHTSASDKLISLYKGEE